MTVELDLVSEASISAAFAQVRETLGDPDVLVYNAGSAIGLVVLFGCGFLNVCRHGLIGIIILWPALVDNGLHYFNDLGFNRIEIEFVEAQSVFSLVVR